MIITDYEATKQPSDDAADWCVLGFIALLVFGCILSVAGLV